MSLQIENELRQILAARVPGVLGDLELRPHLTTAALTPAAVMVLLERVSGYNVILTQRTQHVEHHKGEISLAGGVRDASDRDAAANALREAEEELGVAADDITVLGELDRVFTVSRFVVTPVVGAIDAGYPLRPQAREVDRVLRVPMGVLRDAANWFDEPRTWRGETYMLRSCRFGGDIIWGATSRILQHFLSVVPTSLL